MRRWMPLGLLLSGALWAHELRYEPEDWSEPKSAIQTNVHGDNNWCLWTDDKDADQKWSKGVVLQTPLIPADREKPEDGAPPLHTRITGVPNGKYDLELKSGRTLAISFDNQTWTPYLGGILRDGYEVKDGVVEFWVDDRFAHSDGRNGYYDQIILWPWRPAPVKRAVTTSATKRVREVLDRALVAMSTERGVYLSWRLLAKDDPGLGFNVYRIHNGRRSRVNAAPITRTCDFLDASAPREVALNYEVCALYQGVELRAGGTAAVRHESSARPYVGFATQQGMTFQKVGLGDLDGDGVLDYVLKTPNSNIDPAGSYWKPSPGPYVLEAYRSTGEHLWSKSLGWSIEQGIWYSPLLVYDFDGDGRAEVAAKTGEGDPRSEDGRVRTGAEHLTVFDGRTGEEITRVDWPDRSGFGDGDHGYNYYSRNQLAVAYLDGKKPCLLALRGTYNTMKVDAYELVGGRLRELWKYTDKEGGRRFRGQGAHFTSACDLDGDGRDEVLLGSAVLDDDGSPMWSTGLGHPDYAYIGDHVPSRPGLEVYYGVETAARENGMCLADGRTGEILWGWNEPTRHIHGKGLCADIDPRVPGPEAYGADSVNHQREGLPFFWAVSSGDLLSREIEWSFGKSAAYWDGDLQKELLLGRPTDFEGGPRGSVIDGSRALIADVMGDWREEIITSKDGELRVYTTTEPAMDRRVCLLQDPLYRLDTAMNFMGYLQDPMLTYLPEATAPNVNLTAFEVDDQPRVRVVVSAPLNRPVEGELNLTSDAGQMNPARMPIRLAPGERTVFEAEILGDPGDRSVTAALSGEANLTAHLAIRLPDKPLNDVPMVQAEDYSGEGGGEVHQRDDKVGVIGGAISHWDDAGHWLEWTIDVPQDGAAWNLMIRYSTPNGAERRLSIDDKACPTQILPTTGGFGSLASEWFHYRAVGADGRPLLLKLGQGQHTIRMENVDGQGLNLDYLALVKAGG